MSILLKLQQHLLAKPKHLKPIVKSINIISKLISLFLILTPSSKNYSRKLKKLSRVTLQKLLTKQVKYLQLIKKVQDNHGFIESKECDSLLFSSLVGSAGVSVDLLKARDSKGRWFRRPIKKCDCNE